MRTYEIELDRELGAPVLPKVTALLREQRKAVRALKVLYPGIQVKLWSIDPLDGERVERRELAL